MQPGPTGPLRIALLAPFRYPIAEPFAGGLEAHVWSMARGLRSRGHDVTLFAAPGSDPDVASRLVPYPSSVRPAAADERRDISHDPALVAEEHRAYLTVAELLASAHGRQFDLVHNNSLHYLPVAMAPRLPAPTVSTLHTPPLAMIELAMRTAGHRPSRFVAVSGHTALSWAASRAASGRPIPGSAIQVVPNGVDTDLWRAGPGGGRLVWFGRLVPEKGVELAIAAARRAGRSIDLAGPIIDVAYFRDVIEPMLAADARYLGHFSRHELADVVGRAAASVVTPRWDEPYGMVVAESLSCGTPVAAFARGGVPEILTPRCGRLARADDVAELAVAIDAACGLDRAAARRRAVEHCSVDTMVDSYLGLYAELLAAPPPGSHRGSSAAPPARSAPASSWRHRARPATVRT